MGDPARSEEATLKPSRNCPLAGSQEVAADLSNLSARQAIQLRMAPLADTMAHRLFQENFTKSEYKGWINLKT